MTFSHDVIGVDIAKDWIDIHTLSTGAARRLKTTRAALAEFAAEAAQADALVVFEASGGFERPLLEALDNAGTMRSCVNPARAREFARAAGELAKTDKTDARVLARMGQALQLAPDAPRSVERTRLARLARRLETLKDIEKSEKQRLQVEPDPYIRDTIDSHLMFLKQSLKAVRAEIAELIKATPELAEDERLLRTAPGMGPVLAHRMLAYLPEIGSLDRRAAAALAGIAPFACDSGLMRGRRMIRGGRAEVRRALYLAAFVATKHDPRMRAYRQKLEDAGKPFKLAIIAVARKLLTRLNAMLKNRTEWVA